MILEMTDAVKVARDYMIERGYHFDDEEDGVILIQKMSKECYPTDWDRPLGGLVRDINPTEICAQIESDNLTQWCKVMQAEFFLRLKREMERHGIQTED